MGVTAISFSDYSLTPASNTIIAGINVAEGCPAGNQNDAIRQLMADGKALSLTVAGLSGAMSAAGGVFTGDITRQGKGAYLHYNSAALAAGQVHPLPEGAALPTAAEGVMVFFYT